MKQPLLIGGATTSKRHTAVKVAPSFFTFDHPVIHVLDASRAVTVVQSLLSDDKEEYVEEISDDYEEIREDYYAGLEDKRFYTMEQAVEEKCVIDFDTQPPAPKPAMIGSHKAPDATIEDVLPYIDWKPFFQTFELRGRYPHSGYPGIFNDKRVGNEAKKLHNDAMEMIQKIIKDKSMWLTGCYAQYPANRSENGEDVIVYEDESRSTVKTTLCMLRQQAEKESDDPFYSQADFIAPEGHADYIGMMAVSTQGCEELVAKYEADHDDYNKILCQALADRFVEAYAEYLHRQIRTDLWGYAKGEDLDNADLLKIKYDGIRPAPGYPSQPDHTEKSKIWDVLQAEKLANMKLSDSYSMIPAASVSALVFAHPASEYFAVGQITQDQVASYAERKGQTVEEVERWLGSILGYDRN